MDSRQRPVRAILTRLVLAFAVVTGSAAHAAAEPAAPSGVRLILLGTGGGPFPRKDRASPANALVVDGVAYVIDAGDGVTRQLAMANLPIRDIRAVFLTHLHLDHVGGLPNLIAVHWLNAMFSGGTARMEIVGPPGTSAMVDGARRFLVAPEHLFGSAAPAAAKIATTVAARDAAPGIIYQDENVRVTAVENSHFSALRIADLPSGPNRSYSLRFDTRYGSIVFSGDTGPSPALTELARDADILLSEIIDLDGVMARMRRTPNITEAGLRNAADHMEHEHLIAREVGKIAAQAKVKTLILSHFSEGGDSAGDMAPLLREIGETYRGRVIPGRDLYEHRLP